MISLDNQIVEIECPKCKFKTKVRLKQVRVNDIVICRGCKRNVQLQDHRRSFHKAEQLLRRKLQALSTTIRIKL